MLLAVITEHKHIMLFLHCSYLALDSTPDPQVKKSWFRQRQGVPGTYFLPLEKDHLCAPYFNFRFIFY